MVHKIVAACPRSHAHGALQRIQRRVQGHELSPFMITCRRVCPASQPSRRAMARRPFQPSWAILPLPAVPSRVSSRLRRFGHASRPAEWRKAPLTAWPPTAITHLGTLAFGCRDRAAFEKPGGSLLIGKRVLSPAIKTREQTKKKLKPSGPGTREPGSKNLRINTCLRYAKPLIPNQASI